MSTKHADLVLTNGRIYTVDAVEPWVEAIAIADGRILARGSATEMSELAGAATRIVDLNGHFAMPGIVDVHNHVVMGGQAELFELALPRDARLDAIIALVREAAEKAEPGQWILGAAWGADAISELDNSAALAALDAASLGHPVCLRDETAHNRWVNSEAMRLSGISETTPNPDMGSFGRDAATGKLTGMMIEAAAGIVERVASTHFTEDMGIAAAAQAIKTLNSYGVTGFLEAASMQSVMAAVHGLDQRNALSAWAVMAMPAVEPNFLFGLAGDELFALRENYRGPHVKPDFVKIFLDGVPGARTAAFHEAYLEDPIHGCCFRGKTMVTYPDLVRWLGKCEAQGLAVKIHCAGDAAVSQALDAIDVVRSFNGPTDLIHHIAHASYIHPDDYKRFAELGVAADLSPMIWYPTTFLEGHRAVMGTERAEKFWPNADLIKAGALLAGGSDWPVIPNPDPWNGIEGLVTRENPSGAFAGQALWKEQAVDVATAVAIFTINSAKAIGIEALTGSLAPGKSADIIVLDQNIFEVPANRISRTQVLTTYFEGRAVFERA
ncbi:amidohydrolase [Devosia sp.]|uniref:amidohydrolase n=1 Tax=Devosia sp. TaxID=1871048 RepID=UPI0025E843BF|nr:amidohydrolase [Devosia sp.]MCR6633722.1 amidohydrolase [Devosia sp.]